jgi:hypothetical protein
MRRFWRWWLVWLLCGCTLIDRDTFRPSPEAPSQGTLAAAAAVPAGRVPLVTIRRETPNTNYEDVLSYAVRTAEERRPDIEYDVVTVVPQKGDAAAQAAALQQGRRDAAEVMRSIMDLGVPDTRIHLGARLDPAVSAREVRVYVR